MHKVEFFIGWGTGRRSFGTVDMASVPHRGEGVSSSSHPGVVRYVVRAVEYLPDFFAGRLKVEVTLDPL